MQPSVRMRVLPLLLTEEWRRLQADFLPSGRQVQGAVTQHILTERQRLLPCRRPCPVPYPRLTAEQVAAGSPVPYLFGGQSPSCRQCKGSDPWTNFCKVRARQHYAVCRRHLARRKSLRISCRQPCIGPSS